MAIRNDHPVGHLCNIPREINYLQDDKYLWNSVSVVCYLENDRIVCKINIINNIIGNLHTGIFITDNEINEYIISLSDDLKFIREYPHYNHNKSTLNIIVLYNDDRVLARVLASVKIGITTVPIVVSRKYAEIIITKIIENLKEYKVSIETKIPPTQDAEATAN